MMRSAIWLLATVAFVLASWAAAANSSARAFEYTGVNVAGAEFNGRKVPGKPDTDYFYPTKSTIDYFAAKGMNTLRIPFLWERIQPSLNADLNTSELRRLDQVVDHATARRLHVVLDVHNYAAYRRQPIGTADVTPASFADLWQRLAEHYRNNPNVIFGLMNEPKALPTETWLEAANAAIAAIRRVGAKQLILVPGNGWTGAHSWMSRGYGTPNAEVMLKVVDPANNYAYELHQYLDSNFSGTNPQCRNETIGAKALERVTQWLVQHGKRGFLGEFGGGADPVCLAALNGMLEKMAEQRGAWIGWTYWAAGAWPASYFTSVQPVNGEDRPQMAVLLKHLAKPARRPPG